MNGTFPRLILFAGIALLLHEAASAGQLSISGAVQFTRLSSQYGGANRYSLVPAARYQEDSWYAGVSLPVNSQDKNAMANVGPLTMPGDESQGMNGMSTGGHMSSSPSLMPAMGDAILNGGIRLVSETDVAPSSWVLFQVKAPTAIMGYGTGRWDLGPGIGLRKNFGAFLLSADATYLFVGKPENANYKNSLLYAAAAGYLFDGGGVGILLGYQGSTALLDEIAGQRQLSAGVNIQVADSIQLTATLVKGLTDSTPMASISTGLTVFY